MYLSKIVLDIRHPSVRQALRDVNDMHRNLMAGFEAQSPQGTARADQQVLYRLFSGREQVYLLVSSREMPNLNKLAARGFHTEPALIRDISPLKEVFREGTCFRFELLASPCKKVGGAGNNSRRVFLDTPEARVEWLRRKAEQGGFEILFEDEMANRVDACGHRGAMTIKNSGAVYSGVLRVTNASAFWKSYTCGIGPGKAYGMGMLNLSKA